MTPNETLVIVTMSLAIAAAGYALTLAIIYHIALHVEWKKERENDSERARKQRSQTPPL